MMDNRTVDTMQSPSEKELTTQVNMALRNRTRVQPLAFHQPSDSLLTAHAGISEEPKGPDEAQPVVVSDHSTGSHT